MSTLSPIDLLSVSADEQTILRCLTKYPRLTIFELAEKTGLPLMQVEEVLGALLAQTKVIEQLQQGKRLFSTRFQFKRRAVRNMPGEILALFEQPSAQFLAETPLTAVLPTTAITQLLELSQKRLLLPDEVLAWQGQKVEFVGLVQRGLLAYTRLKGRHTGQKGGYVHRTEWIGLTEALSKTAVTATYTAVTEATLLVWPAHEFLEFAQRHCGFSLTMAHQLSHQLRECEKAQTQGQSKLWVVEGAHAGAGATTFALNLALLTHQQTAQTKTRRTLFWPMTDGPTAVLPFLPPLEAPTEKAAGLARITTYPCGLDVLSRIERNSYSPQVQLDILLADLFSRYEYIIADTGSDAARGVGSAAELRLRLRGQAHTLITLTRDSDGAETGISRWHTLQPYSFPGQKRVLALNGSTVPPTSIDARFHLVIPWDEAGVGTAVAQNESLVTAVPDSLLAQALQEVCRRLSLNHTVALFVPSTLDVSQHTDNSAQVQSTLSFLGNLFGGATSSNAEGAWRSEESGLVTEQVTIVRTFVSKKALDTHLDDVLSFAAELKRDMKQEAVAISVDHQLILV
ncbi:MAG: cyclic nucleotide-binding domain-containing protein [Anaerolineae bacterium]|nr:cyclic nucleotide-binding domain-containing protein [Anaerolineae bacterium]